MNLLIDSEFEGFKEVKTIVRSGIGLGIERKVNTYAIQNLNLGWHNWLNRIDKDQK